MLPVAIIGRADQFLSSPVIRIGGKDVWAFNAGAMHYPITASFQMHQYPYVRDEGNHIAEYHAWLRNLKTPVYMRDPRDEFPTAVLYPFEEIYAMVAHIRQGLTKLTNIKYFTSTVAYAIALAVLQGRPRIDVYNIELTGKTEYEKQRECYLFWIGFAAGKGIALDIYCGDGIFKKPLYGEQWEN